MVHLESWMQAMAAPRGPQWQVRAAVELEPERWPAFFEEIACVGAGVLATLEVLRARPNAPAGQPPQELHGIGYRPGDDVLELSVAPPGRSAALRYFIAAPRRIRLRESAEGAVLLVEDASGTATLIRLSNLPRPAAGRAMG